MTVTDLRLKYKQDTGVYPDKGSDILNSPLNWFERDDLEKYTTWLEEQLLATKPFTIKGKDLLSILNKEKK